MRTQKETDSADEIERLTAELTGLNDANDALIEIGHKQHERIAELEGAISGGIPSEMIAALADKEDK